MRVQDADVNAVLDRFSSIGNEAQPEVDMSAEQWLRNNGASDRMVSIADACIANDFGCSIDQLGLRESIIENQNWDVGSSSPPSISHKYICAMTNNIDKAIACRAN